MGVAREMGYLSGIWGRLYTVEQGPFGSVLS